MIASKTVQITFTPNPFPLNTAPTHITIMAAVPEPTTPTPSMAAESPLPPPPDGAPRLYRQASANAACRFCFGGEEGGQLFQPCLCNGSQKYVHVTCLHQWRKTSSNASMRCPTCQYQYNIKHLNVSDSGLQLESLHAQS